MGRRCFQTGHQRPARVIDVRGVSRAPEDRNAALVHLGNLRGDDLLGKALGPAAKVLIDLLLPTNPGDGPQVAHEHAVLSGPAGEKPALDVGGAVGHQQSNIPSGFYRRPVRPREAPDYGIDVVHRLQSGGLTVLDDVRQMGRVSVLQNLLGELDVVAAEVDKRPRLSLPPALGQSTDVTPVHLVTGTDGKHA